MLDFTNRLSKEINNDYLTLFYRWAAGRLAERAANTFLSPDQITVATVILGGLAALLFSLGNYPGVVLGAVSAQFAILGDYIDGPLARLKGISTPHGSFLDSNLSRLVDFFIYFGITIGAYRYKPEIIIWVLGFVFMGVRYLIDRQIMYFRHMHFRYTELTASLDSFQKKANKFKLLKPVLPSRLSIYMFISLFSLLNRLDLFLYIFSIYCCFFYIFLFFNIMRRITEFENT